MHRLLNEHSNCWKANPQPCQRPWHLRGLSWVPMLAPVVFPFCLKARSSHQKDLQTLYQPPSDLGGGSLNVAQQSLGEMAVPLAAAASLVLSIMVLLVCSDTPRNFPFSPFILPSPPSSFLLSLHPSFSPSSPSITPSLRENGDIFSEESWRWTR